jgi:hypothetical protein
MRRIVAMLGLAALALGAPLTFGATPAFAKSVLGTGAAVCTLTGTLTLDTPWSTSGAGEVTGVVNFSGSSSCVKGDGSPTPSEIHLSGKVTFTNGACGPSKTALSGKLKATYMPDIKPSEFELKPISAEITDKGFGGSGPVTGSYARTGNIGSTSPGVAGNCTTGITSFTYGPTAPGSSFGVGL